MDLLRPQHISALIDAPKGPSVSIYVPTHLGGPETRQDPIRLKNLLGEAEERLREAIKPAEADELLAPARELLEAPEFWQHQGHGLAVFLSPELRRSFRLPIPFEELVVVGDRFHVKPLLRLLTADRRYLVLAISQQAIRLLQGSRQTVEEVVLEDVPASLREVAVHREMAALQFHSGGGPGGKGGRQRAVYHGHGTETDEELIRKYFRAIDQGMRKAIPDERAPLVLAGVRYLRDLYRHTSEYPEIAPDGIDGNPDDRSDQELAEEAWELIEPRLAAERRADAERFGDLAPRDLAVSGVTDTVPAAFHGRVETLWVAQGVQRWGSFDQETAKVQVRETPREGDHDLLDLAAAQALSQGGTVYVTDVSEIPGDAPIAALLRY